METVDIWVVDALSLISIALVAVLAIVISHYKRRERIVIQTLKADHETMAAFLRARKSARST